MRCPSLPRFVLQRCFSLDERRRPTAETMASSTAGPSRQRAYSSAASISISSGSSDGYYDSDDELDFVRKQQQKEWEEGIEQLQVLVSAVLIPVIGKWLGRRWSGWCEFFLLFGFWERRAKSGALPVFDRYLRLGLGKTFFLGQHLAAFIKLPSSNLS